jgi:putative heme-binding domain-containing protein
MRHLPLLVLLALCTVCFAGEKAGIEVPTGFKIELYVAAPEISAPTSVAATPTGELFVGEDPMNVREHVSGTGRILKCVDPKGDGKCGKITVFADKTNGPRGMTYVDGTLYVVHQPFLTAFRDEDGDGVAEKSEILINGLGPVPEKVPPDHAINGVRMSIDGWLYIACGDQGIPNAVAKDGTKLQMRGGGVVRIRPDGSELEIYVSGLRNVYDMAMDGLFNGFTRDNTNDGGGWNVRFSQIVQSAEYGYPKLYMNYADELLPCLHDFGGGSGTGSMWIQEPGFPPEFNNTAFTSDWGTGRIYKFSLEPNGASYKEKQEEFAKGGRVTDIDMDGQGALYVADWSPHSYGKSPNPFGHIYRITHPASQPVPAFPNLEKCSDAELLGHLASDSMTRRVAAQRVLLRRPQKAENVAALEKTVEGSGPLFARVAALFTLKQMLGAKSHEFVLRCLAKTELREFALRALTDRKSQLEGVTLQPFLDALKDNDPRVRQQAVICLGRLGKMEAAPALLPMLADAENNIRHVAMRALRALNASAVCIEALEKDKPEVVAGAFRALRELHTPECVAGLTQKLGAAKDPALKQEIVRTLGRLYFKEGEWDGGWWAIRPDTRGPYYVKATWEKSEDIAKTLGATITSGDEAEARAALESLGKFQIFSPEMVTAVTKLAETAGPLQSDALKSLLQMKELGPNTAALLEKVALSKETDAAIRSDAVQAFERVQGDQKTATLLSVASKLGDNADLQATAYGTLMKLKDKSATDEVAKSWADESKSELLIAAVRKAKIESQYGHVRDLVLDKRPAVRKAAIAALADVKDNNAIDRLLEAAEKDTERADAIRAVGKIGNGKLQPGQLMKNSERLIGIAEKVAGGADKQLAKETLDITRAFCSDRKLKPEDSKKLLARIPKLGSQPAVAHVTDFKYEELVEKVMQMPGDKAVGAELFKKQKCVECHTLSSQEKPKGPFLGDIGVRYKRKELAESVLKPSAVIAFGFNTNLITLDNGERFEGFIAREGGDEIEVRNIAGETKTIVRSLIKKQVVQKQSTMPEGLADTLTIDEFAGLMAYLESLKAEKK